MSGFRTILAPTDFSGCSDTALAFAVDRFGKDPSYLLLHVVDEGLAASVAEVTRQPIEEVVEEMWSRASRRLAERRTALEGDGVRASASVCRGEPYARIGEEAARRGAEVIVIGAHGRSHEEGRERFGGTAERVVRAAPVPVLCVPDPEEDG